MHSCRGFSRGWDKGRRSRGDSCSSASTDTLCSLTCSSFARSPWHQLVAISTWQGWFVLKRETSKDELRAFIFQKATTPESLTFMVLTSGWQKSAT